MLAVISILVLFLQPLVLKQETFLAFRPQQEKGSVEVITGDVATTNGVHSVNSRTELSANPVTPQPTQTMVMTVPAKNKSDSSIADVLVNEYASNGDKQSKNSYGSEASVTGKKVDVFSFGNIQMLTIVFSEHLRGFMGLSRVFPNIYKSSLAFRVLFDVAETMRSYRVFSHDVTAAILVSQNNETAAMMVPQTNPLGVELFSYANAFFCFNKFA